MNGWVVDYTKLRDPWWRFKRYVKMWLITMTISLLIGWLIDRWNGVLFHCLFVTCFQVVVFALWEFGERRKDHEWKQGRWP